MQLCEQMNLIFHTTHKISIEKGQMFPAIKPCKKTSVHGIMCGI